MVLLFQHGRCMAFPTSQLAQACRVYETLCNLLLQAYESLEKTLNEYMRLLPSPSPVSKNTDCHKKLQLLTQNVKVSIFTSSDFGSCTIDWHL